MQEPEETVSSCGRPCVVDVLVELHCDLRSRTGREVKTGRGLRTSETSVKTDEMRCLAARRFGFLGESMLNKNMSKYFYLNFNRKVATCKGEGFRSASAHQRAQEARQRRLVSGPGVQVVPSLHMQMTC